MLIGLEIAFGIVLPFALWFLHDRQERSLEASRAQRTHDAGPGRRLA